MRTAITPSQLGSMGSTPPRPCVTIALARIGEGNFSNVKSVGAGVYECRIDFGPGYRVYFGKDGERIVILIGGGTKKRQQRDIAMAQKCWAGYKRRKKPGDAGNAPHA